MNRILASLLGLVMIVFNSAAEAQSTKFGMSCPGTWVQMGTSNMCRCPDGSFGNAVGVYPNLRIVCPTQQSGQTSPRQTACPQGKYQSGNKCVQVGHKLCPGGRHSCPQGQSCTATGCLPAGASVCPNSPTQHCEAPLKCETDLQGQDRCFTDQQLLELHTERWRRDFISNVQSREARLHEAHRNFTARHAMPFDRHVQQLMLRAFEQEQAWPAERKRELEQARKSAFEQIQDIARQLEGEAEQIAEFEAPLRAVLNPELADPANWSTLSPDSPPDAAAPDPETGAGFTPRPGSTFASLPDVSFPSCGPRGSLGREDCLRRLLELERQRARGIDRDRAMLLAAELPTRVAVIAGSAAADTLGYGMAYSIATAAPGIYLEQQSVLDASGELAAGYVGSKFIEQAGAPPGVGTAASALTDGVEYWHSWRLLLRTRSR